MRPSIWLLIGAVALMAAGVRGSPLDSELGRTRPLAVVAPGPGDPVVGQLHEALADPATAAALADRQIAVFTVIAGQGAHAGAPIDPPGTAVLLAALGLRADGPAAVVLVGKDGGVKLRLTRFAVADIMSAVDAMPMRRQEVRRH